MTSASLRKASATAVKGDAVVIGVHTNGTTLSVARGADDVAAAFGKDFVSTLDELGASGKVGEVCKVASGGATKTPIIVAVGLGPVADTDLESLRRAAGAAARSLAGKK
ncbi:MAG: M17 family peptidase N-terminal domain-containing protein, partial [Nocardioidaceae bacterium]